MGTPTTDVTDDGTSIIGRTGSDYHRLVRDERRRRIVRVLLDRGTPIELSELATAVGTRAENAGVADDVSISLHHVHLPLLDDVGVVDYDPDACRVEDHDDALEQLDSLLEDCADDCD